MNLHSFLRIFGSLIAAFIMLVAGYALASVVRNNRDAVLVANIPFIGRNDGRGTSLTIEVAPLTESTELYSIQGGYPRFPDAKELTEGLDTFIEEVQTSFIKAVEENNQARQDTAPGGETVEPLDAYLEVTWEPSQLTREILSFKVQIDAYEGGANASQEIRTFNYNVKEKRSIELSELFSGSDYLNRISRSGRSILRTTLANQGSFSQEILNLGTEPIRENFSNFTFNETVVTFHYPKFGVAPGALGPQQFSLPRE